MGTRKATHAGSWYSGHGPTLRTELKTWLDEVPDVVQRGRIPLPDARMIIAPHAGYKFSGATAAYAYKSLDVSKAERVFLLGPSHHVYLSGCALSRFNYYDTPLGKLRLDRETIDSLAKHDKFKFMSGGTDQDEHSLELHLPYIYKMLDDKFKSEGEFPTLVPILVGNTSPQAEQEIGTMLSEYLEDPGTVFIISSDFAHWGERFRYTRYMRDLDDLASMEDLAGNDTPNPRQPAIHESIGRLDRIITDQIEAGDHASYWRSLDETGNTVCGRHPIGIALAALEALARRFRVDSTEARFRFVRYARSSDCRTARDSSVSYASAFVIVHMQNNVAKELEAEAEQA